MDNVNDEDETMSEGSAESHTTSGESSSDEDDEYICSFCEQRFDRASNLNLHLCVAPADRNTITAYASATASNSNQPDSSAIASSSTSAPVIDWSQRASCSNEGQQSTQTVHERMCLACGKIFNDPNTLADHQRDHINGGAAEPNEPYPFKCTLCPAKYAQRNLLFLHLLNDHKSSQVEGLRKPAKMWFKPIGRRQIRVGGGHQNSQINGCYVVFEGIVMGVTTDMQPIGPVVTRIAHNVNRTDFTERDFWETVRNDIMPVYNSRPGVDMFITIKPSRSTSDDDDDPNNNNNDSSSNSSPEPS